MKKKFTFFCLLATTLGIAQAGTPTIDGAFDGEPVWGAPFTTADGNAGLGNANAKKLYVTSDADYYYFGAEVTASDWMQWCFILNAKPGGATSDSWGRAIQYNHTEKPDFAFRGNFNSYAELHNWNGSAWAGFTGLAWSEFSESISGTDANGFVETRIPRSTFPGYYVGDIQFYITGNSGNHGSFDAIPNDNNSTAWELPQSLTVLRNYTSGLVLPVNLRSFSGTLNNKNVALNWLTASESNLSRFEIEQSADGRNWASAGTVVGANKANGASYDYTIRNFNSNFMLYRLKIINRNGSYQHSGQIVIKTKSNKTIELLGTISSNMIRVAVHNHAAATYQTELIGIDGRRISTSIYQHAGGSGTMSIPVPTHAAKGMYLLRVNHGVKQEVLKVILQ
ncbi:MAG: hypothetical protein EAY75_11660 [Bacteroidetes bacterium]|nr:MAG: hypothetical protein EAY75_11660 [Bacteroidota bacterium]